MRKVFAILSLAFLSACAAPQLRGTGDLGLVIERASGQLTLVDTSRRAPYARVSKGLAIFRMPRPCIRATGVTPSFLAVTAG